MTLDDQLRTLADQVPAAPTADPVELYSLGRGRRRRRRVAGAGGAFVLVGAMVLGLAQLGGVDRPEVANMPTVLGPEEAEAPVVVGEAVAGAVGTEPFPFSVGLAPGTDGLWCLVGLGSQGQLDTSVGQPCDVVLLPDRASDPDRVAVAFRTSLDLPDQQASGFLLFGFAPAGTDEVVLVLSDGTRTPGAVADGPVEGNVLFGVGWVDTVGVEPVEVEARGPYGEVVERLDADPGSTGGSSVTQP